MYPRGSDKHMVLGCGHVLHFLIWLSGPETPKTSEKRSLGAAGSGVSTSLEKVSKKSRSLENVSKRSRKDFDSRETLFRLLWAFGPQLRA